MAKKKNRKNKEEGRIIKPFPDDESLLAGDEISSEDAILKVLDHLEERIPSIETLNLYGSIIADYSFSMGRSYQYDEAAQLFIGLARQALSEQNHIKLSGLMYSVGLLVSELNQLENRAGAGSRDCTLFYKAQAKGVEANKAAAERASKAVHEWLVGHIKLNKTRKNKDLIHDLRSSNAATFAERYSDSSLNKRFIPEARKEALEQP